MKINLTNMNIKKNILLVGAAILVIGSASVASAQVVYNVQFEGSYSGTPGPNYTGQGALATTGSLWNGVPISDIGGPYATITSGDLVASNGGAPSAYTVTVNNVYGFNLGASGYDINPTGNALLDAYASNADYAVETGAASASTFSINGLTPGSTYTLYLYGDVAYNAYPTAFSVEGSGPADITGPTSGLPAPADWTSGVEYVEFTGTVDGTGTITGDWYGTTEGEQTGGFNGLQLQVTSPSLSVPEPSVTILLGLGFMSLVVLRRARRIS